MSALTGQTALVTGASGGIGRVVALALSRAGADLVLHCGRNRAAAENLALEVGGARVLQADLRMLEEIDRIATELESTALDILVNNAGVWRSTPLGETSRDVLDEILNANLRGLFWLTNRLAPQLSDDARIVNISSVAAQTASASGRSLYRATKAALDSLTRNWALELAPRGIRVNAVAPGFVDTAMTAQHLADPATRKGLLARHPLGRLTTAEEVADAVLFLCAEQSRHITGQVINVSGGFVV
jgi:NAD(P)-dependent dehydrogenase (short-subunit alcohol dehydrogenase family)